MEMHDAHEKNGILITIKKSLLNLEKSITKNRELRVKYYDQPSKFFESECELYNELQSFIMNMPETANFSLLIQLKFIDTLFELLSHENTDIAICVLQILLDMSDTEDLLKHESISEQFFDALASNNCFKAINELLRRFVNEQEIENCETSLMDNLLEYDRESLNNWTEVLGDLLVFLLDFIKYDKRESYLTMKLHAADILGVLLQMDLNNNQTFHSKNGVKLLLEILSMYKTDDPLKGEERELMEILFDTLCSCLLFEFNNEQFYANDGIQLMIVMLKGKKKSCFGAIKVLSFLFARHENIKIHVHTFIEKLGLKYLFPLFMKNLKNSSTMSRNDYDEHFCTIIKSLLKNSEGIHYQRVVNKFIENGFEKLDRLLEIFSMYTDKLNAFDRKTLNQLQRNNSVIEDYKNEPSIYNERLGNGLFTLQLVSIVLLELLTLDNSDINIRIANYFHQNSINILKLVDIIQDYCEKLTEGPSILNERADNIDPTLTLRDSQVAFNERKRLELLLRSVKNI